MDPLVSIITPAFNHAPYIGKCIRSVLAQGFPGWEQIIIDDGSTDRTALEVKAFRDPRIRYVYQENKGPFRLSESYNRALGMSRGEFIAVLEGDDFWPRGKLEKQLPLFDDGCVLTWGRALEADHKGRELGAIPAWGRRAPEFNGNPFNYLLRQNAIPAVSVMVRRDALLSIGGFRQVPGVPCVDYPTWLALAGQGRFRFADGISGCWRSHGSQVTALLWDTEVVLRLNDHRLAVFDSLGAAQKRGLEFSRRDIVKNNKKLLAYNSYRRGRIELMRSNPGKGRAFLAEAFRTGPARLRMRAALDIFLSHIRGYGGPGAKDYTGL